MKISNADKATAKSEGICVPMKMKKIKAISLFEGLNHYRKTVSILKKGYEQERYRIAQIQRSSMALKKVHEISSVEIATYRDTRLKDLNRKTGKNISPATVILEMSLLSNFFDLARIEWGYTMAPNPCKDVRKPKTPPGRDRRLLVREERQILRYAHAYPNKELYAIIVLALTTAMRQGEILSLRWDHISARYRVAHLPETKNGTARDVPLSAKAYETLLHLGAKPEGRVFSYNSSGLKSVWRVMTQRLGINDLHFHDLRHEAISRLFELGTLNIMEIAAISGHKSLAMLKRYTHLQAARLVHKLEGSRSKARLAVLRHLVPYPGIVTRTGAHIRIHFPDFECGTVGAEALTREDAILGAQNSLLRKLVGALRLDKKIPPPDQYLSTQPDAEVLMVDPIAITV